MRIAAAVPWVLAAAFTAPAFGQSFVVEWTATAVTPEGNVSETLTVTKTADGYAIKAELIGPVPEGTLIASPGTDIVLDGNTYSYMRTVTTPRCFIGDHLYWHRVRGYVYNSQFSSERKEILAPSADENWELRIEH
jgi:hypothetical protein